MFELAALWAQHGRYIQLYLILNLWVIKGSKSSRFKLRISLLSHLNLLDAAIFERLDKNAVFDLNRERKGKCVSPKNVVLRKVGVQGHQLFRHLC